MGFIIGLKDFIVVQLEQTKKDASSFQEEKNKKCVPLSNNMKKYQSFMNG